MNSKANMDKISMVILGVVMLTILLIVGYKAIGALKESNCASGSTFDDSACYSCASTPYVYVYNSTANNCIWNGNVTTSLTQNLGDVGNETAYNLTIQTNLVDGSGYAYNGTVYNSSNNVTSVAVFNYTNGSVYFTGDNLTDDNITVGYQYVNTSGIATTTRTEDGSITYNATKTLEGSNGLGMIPTLLPVIIIVLLFAGLMFYFKVIKS
jgi:uncharacterized membrane protein